MSKSLPPPPDPSPTNRPPIPPNGILPLSTPLLYIGQTQTKGLGLFATRDLPPGTLLLLESPLLYIPNSEIADLTPRSQYSWTSLTTYLGGILQDPLNRVVGQLPWDKQLAFYNLSYGSVSGSRERSIVWRNGFAVEGLQSTVVGGMVSRLNHCCVPNAKISWCTAKEMDDSTTSKDQEQEGCLMSGGLEDGEVFTAGPTAHFDELVRGVCREKGGKMMLWNHLTIKKGEEVTIDYGYTTELLKEHYGFECSCPVCSSGLVRSDLAESRRERVRYGGKGKASKYTTPKSSRPKSSESIKAVTRQNSYDRLAKQRSKNSGIGVLETLYRVQGDQAGDFEDEDMGGSGYQTCEELDLPAQRPFPSIPEKDSPAIMKAKNPETSTDNSSCANIFEAKQVNYTKLNQCSLHLVNMSKITPPASSQTSPSLCASESCSLSPPSFDAEESNLSPLRHPETLGDLITISTSAKHHGLGVFALKPLMSGTLVLLESPLLFLPYPISSHRACKHLKPDPIDAIIHGLPPSRRSAFCRLHRHTTSPANPYREIIWTNAFGVNRTNNGVDKGDNAVFEVTCRINHSCRPNCKWHWKKANVEKGEREGKMMVYALRDISEGEELSIDYGFTSDELERQYGFRCDCGNCDDVLIPEGGGRPRVGGLSEGAGMNSTPHIKESNTNSPNISANAENTEMESPLNSLLQAPFTHKPSTLPPPRRHPETLGTLLQIRPSIHNNQPRGLGVFALHEIPPSRLLLNEVPLFIYPSNATFAQILHTLSTLEPEEMSTINDLCALQNPPGRELEIDELLRASAFLRLDRKCKGIFEVACRINHACPKNSNCNWVWGQRMLVRAKRTILKGEEVTISYGEEDGEKMKEIYGFVCDCGVGCVNDKTRTVEESVDENRRERRQNRASHQLHR